MPSKNKIDSALGELMNKYNGQECSVSIQGGGQLTASPTPEGGSVYSGSADTRSGAVTALESGGRPILFMGSGKGYAHISIG